MSKTYYYVIKDGRTISDYKFKEEAEMYAEMIGGEVSSNEESAVKNPIKEELRKNREEKIRQKANKQYKLNEYSPERYNESQMDKRNAFVEGAKWADTHPNGFINEEKYLNRLWERKEITNKEFIEILKTFPEDAEISIECCNPRAMVYDEKNNLIRID